MEAYTNTKAILFTDLSSPLPAGLNYNCIKCKFRVSEQLPGMETRTPALLTIIPSFGWNPSFHGFRSAGTFCNEEKYQVLNNKWFKQMHKIQHVSVFYNQRHHNYMDLCFN